MKISVNLATHPFRRDRPVMVVSALLGIALIGLLAALISLNLMQRNQLADARRDVDRLQKQIRGLGVEQAKLDQVLRRPENAEVLERSLFLNALLYRKGVSWTRILEDLGTVLPHNVRVMSVRPTLNAQNEVALDLQVGTESPEALSNFIRALEDSPLFGPPNLHSSMPPTQNDPMWKYRVSVNYAQKL